MFRQGGLARAVAAQQRDELAAVDGDVDPVEGQHPRRVAVGQVDGLQDGGSLRFGSLRHLAAAPVAGADSGRRDPPFVVEERAGRAEIRESALLQHQEQIRPGGHGIRVVIHHDHGASRSAQVRDDAPHRRRPLRVEGRGGFVEDQDLRFHREYSGDSEPLELPAGQGGRLAIRQARQPDLFQGPPGPGEHLVAAQPQVRGTGGDVVDHQALHHLGLRVLRDQTDDAHQVGRRRLVGGDARDPQLPVEVAGMVVGNQAVQGHGECRLARTRGAHHRDAAPGGDVAGDAGKLPGSGAAVGETEPSGLDHRAVGFAVSSATGCHGTCPGTAFRRSATEAGSQARSTQLAGPPEASRGRGWVSHARPYPADPASCPAS